MLCTRYTGIDASTESRISGAFTDHNIITNITPHIAHAHLLSNLSSPPKSVKRLNRFVIFVTPCQKPVTERGPDNIQQKLFVRWQCGRLYLAIWLFLLTIATVEGITQIYRKYGVKKAYKDNSYSKSLAQEMQVEGRLLSTYHEDGGDGGLWEPLCRYKVKLGKRKLSDSPMSRLWNGTRK